MHDVKLRQSQNLSPLFFISPPNRDVLIALYADMQKLTEDLLNSHMIRQKNFQEIQKSLQAVNGILKAASKLRGMRRFKVESM